LGGSGLWICICISFWKTPSHPKKKKKKHHRSSPKSGAHHGVCKKNMLN
jgi:hypothetical protein